MLNSKDQVPGVADVSDPMARERYEDIARQIEREDGLVNTRTTWLITSQALLFAGAAAILAALFQRNDLIKAMHVAAMGVIIGLLLLALNIAERCERAIAAAHGQLLYLQTGWNDPRLYSRYPRPFGGDLHHADGVRYPLLIAGNLKTFSKAGIVGALVYVFVLCIDGTHSIPKLLVVGVYTSCVGAILGGQAAARRLTKANQRE